MKHLSCIEIHLRNIAALREYDLTLNAGEVTEITGRPGVGKTSVLQSVKWLASGKPLSFPNWLVTDGENDGSMTAVIDGGDGGTVTRKFKTGETAGELTLLDSNGMPVTKKTMEVLRSWVGDGTRLDPAAIVAMTTAERTKTIAAALNLDPAKAAAKLSEITGKPVKISSREEIYPVIDTEYHAFYEARKLKNLARDEAEKGAKAVLSYLPKEWYEEKGDVPRPAQPEPLGDIHDKKRAAEVRNAERENLQGNIAEIEDYFRRSTEHIAGDEIRLNEMKGEVLSLGKPEDTGEVEAEIARLQRKLSDMRERNMKRTAYAEQIASMEKTLTMARERQEERKPTLIAYQSRERELGGMEDVSALQSTINAHADKMEIWQHSVEEWGEQRIRWEQHDALIEKAEDLQGEWITLQRQVKKIEALPVNLLDGVPLPIPGMVISGDKIFLPDARNTDANSDATLREFDQFGQAERYHFALLMVMTLSPVNVVCIDGMERCGDDELRLQIYQEIADAGFIGLTTRVTKGPLTATVAASGPDWNQPKLF